MSNGNTQKPFISPTMDWIYGRYAGWTESREMLYELGFSASAQYDVHGFDKAGFNKLGKDRLGCTREDYDNEEILRAGRIFGDTMSLSNKIALPLPKFLKLMPVLRDACRITGHQMSDGWSVSRVMQCDEIMRMFMFAPGRLVIAMGWRDATNNKDCFVTISDDTVAKFETSDPENDFYFRMAVKTGETGWELVEKIVCSKDLEEASLSIKDFVAEHVSPSPDWLIYIADSHDGPYLAAGGVREMEEANGDIFVGSIKASSKFEALEMVRDRASTNAVREMADLGLAMLAPEVSKTPRP